jgi:hypothetical protein
MKSTRVKLGPIRPIEPMEVLSGGARRKRRRPGDGMLTPVRPLEIRDPYTGVEQLHPGRSRVAVDWWGVKRRPELFRLVNRDDAVGAARHRELLVRAGRQIKREITGTTRTSTPSRRGRFRIPARRPSPWRLPQRRLPRSPLP